jgi:hypothetical protein
MPPAVTESLLLMAFAFVVNLPFGYWREGTAKFSPAWFVAVHAAVPLILLLRYALGLEWRLVALPFTVAAYFAGQTVGARRRRRLAGTASAADQA